MNEAENLTAHLDALREATRGMRSSPASREMLLAKFNSQSKIRTMPAVRKSWYWMLSAAAALTLGILAVPHAERPQIQQAVVQAVDVPAEPDADGFIAVPYLPPLATGEMLRVVHTELNPAALASLGVNVDPAWTSWLPADLLLGEDGMPRAVRVADTSSESGGS